MNNMADMSLSDSSLSPLSLTSLRLGLARMLKTFLVALGWGMTLAAITLWAVFQGLLLPKSDIVFAPISPPSLWYTESYLVALYYAMLFAASILAGLYVGDMGRAIIAFFGSYLIGAIIIYEVLSFPGLLSTDIGFRESLAKFSVNWTFVVLFPFPLAVGLIGGIIGAGLQETIIG